MMLYILVVIAFVLGAGLVLGSLLRRDQGAGHDAAAQAGRAAARKCSAAGRPSRGDGGEPGAAEDGAEGGPMPALDQMIGGHDTRARPLATGSSRPASRPASAPCCCSRSCTAASFGFARPDALVKMPIGVRHRRGLGFALPFIFLKCKRTRRIRAFEEEFPEALDLIARALKAGHAFVTGLKMVADEMPEPVGPEFRKTFDEQNFGLPLKDALENLTDARARRSTSGSSRPRC